MYELKHGRKCCMCNRGNILLMLYNYLKHILDYLNQLQHNFLVPHANNAMCSACHNQKLAFIESMLPSLVELLAATILLA